MPSKGRFSFRDGGRLFRKTAALGIEKSHAGRNDIGKIMFFSGGFFPCACLKRAFNAHQPTFFQILIALLRDLAETR